MDSATNFFTELYLNIREYKHSHPGELEKRTAERKERNNERVSGRDPAGKRKA